MNTINKVLIVGGGIGGLTARQALRKLNIEAVVCDKVNLKENKVFKGAGIGIWKPSLEIMKALDIDLYPDGRLMTSAGYKSKDGNWLARPSGSLSTSNHCLCMDRTDLVHHLADFDESDEDIKMGEGWGLSHYKNKGSKVEATFENGETMEFDFLIGADGIHSKTRSQMMGDEAIDPQYCGYSFYRAIIHNPSDELVSKIEINGDRPSFETWGPSQRFALVPLKEPQLFWFGSFRQNEPIHRMFDENAKKEQKDHALSIFGDYHYPIPDLIQSTESKDFVFTDIYELDEDRIKQWYSPKDRVALLGDSVHSVAPNLAQGASLAIEDAIELASCLNMYNIGKYESMDQTLEAYQQARSWRAKRVRFISNMIANIGQHPNPTFSLWRNRLMRMVPQAISSPIFDKVLKYSLGGDYKLPKSFREF